MNKSVKHIVIFAIGLVSAVMMLIGLACNVVLYDMNLPSQASNYLQTNATGFSMLSFAFSDMLKATMTLCGFDEAGVQLFEKLLGVGSLLMLCTLILQVIVLLKTFFTSGYGQCKVAVKRFLIIDIIVSTIYGLLGIIFVADANVVLKEALGEELAGGTTFSFETSGWVALLLQIICFVAFVIVDINMPDKQDSKIASAGAKSKKVAVRKEKEDDTDLLVKILTDELEVVKVLEKYKMLCDAKMLSNDDYTIKKAGLLKYTRNRLQECPTAQEGGVSAQAEVIIVELLEKYQALLNMNIITLDEFINQKRILLRYSII